MSMVIQPMVDMIRKPEDITTPDGETISREPYYPYGLCASLQDQDLAKLGMGGKLQVGGLLHGHFMAKITSVSKRAEEGDNVVENVEIQITHLSAENEEEENEDVEEKEPLTLRARKVLYSKQ